MSFILIIYIPLFKVKEQLPSHSKNGLLVLSSCEISTGPEAWIKPAIEAKTHTDPVRVFVSIESVLMRESGKGQERILQVMKVSVFVLLKRLFLSNICTGWHTCRKWLRQFRILTLKYAP